MPLVFVSQLGGVEHTGGPLLPHWQGFVVLGFAAAAVLLLMVSQRGPVARILGAIGLAGLGLGSSAYVTHATEQLAPSPLAWFDRPLPEPGVASALAATGGLLLVVSAALLVALALAPTLKRRPVFDRTHPTWM